MSKFILVTGGCGFIGSNFIRYLDNLNEPIEVLNIDKVTYAGNPKNLSNLQMNYQLIEGDICDEVLLKEVFTDFPMFDYVVHFAAESHVDNSISGPGEFIKTNLIGTYNLLEASRKHYGTEPKFKFLHVSTDEVYGSLGDTGKFTEETSYDPSSPYSATKAGSDHLVRAWNRTYDLPTLITNCSNNYGPYQYPEKLIPLIVLNCLKEKPLPVYGKGLNVRDWLYVEDHCDAIWTVLNKGVIGETYNIGGNNEIKNIDIVKSICIHLDEMHPRLDGSSYTNLIEYVTDRPGHDFRYAIDASKIERDLGWKPSESFLTGIKKTIMWYLENNSYFDKK